MLFTDHLLPQANVINVDLFASNLHLVSTLKNKGCHSFQVAKLIITHIVKQANKHFELNKISLGSHT